MNRGLESIWLCKARRQRSKVGASQQAYRKEPDTSLFAGLFFRGCLGYSQMRKTQKEENIPGPNRSPGNNCLDSSGVTEGRKAAIRQQFAKRLVAHSQRDGLRKSLQFLFRASCVFEERRMKQTEEG